MSRWPGKYVIGLTGNIATGKSVVRKMLEHLGAYSIDADALAHRAMAKGAPAYQPVVDFFGKWILGKNQEVDRVKLGTVVFNNPDAMRKLEEITHPFVRQAIEILAKRSKHDVVVIEAIKLLEGNLAAFCDSLWVTDAPESLQSARLMQKRGLSSIHALQRIRVQNSQEAKIDAADIVIDNSGSFEELWKQVVAGWERIALGSEEDAVEEVVREAKSGDFAVKRGLPRHTKSIATLMTSLCNVQMNSSDVMEAFGEKAFFILKLEDESVGLAGWQVENLVCRVTDLCIDSRVSLKDGLKVLIEEVEKASKSLQSEASLLFLNAELAAHDDIWKNLGYEKRTPQSLGVQAWEDAASEKISSKKTLFFKQLRVDRVLRPM